MDNLTYGIYTNITKTEKQNKRRKYLWSGTCTVCGKKVYKELSLFKKRCKQCHHQKNHKINNYVELYMPTHHLARDNGYVYEHYLVAEKMLGRELKKGETVHHKDRNRSNNDPSNLMVFKTNADHSRFHKTNIAILEEDVYVSPKQYNKCPNCGKIISNTAKTCKKCYKRKIKRIQQSKRPPKEELEKLIYITPFTTLGKKYGVSDNAVRKWCKYYNLPYKKKDMLR